MVSVVAAPVPLVAVPDPSGAGEMYRVTANLAFQETAGKAARITALKVTVSSTATPGWTSTVRTDVSIAVAAKGSAAYTLPTTFAAGAPDPAAQMGVGRDGCGRRRQRREVAPFRCR